MLAQTFVAQPLRVAAAKRTASRAAVQVVARAPVQLPAAFKQASLGVASFSAALVASPAFALVDDRLNGDGAGIALGVNDPVLGAHLLGVFTAIWALYYVANSSDSFLQSGGKDDDSGLSL